MIHDQLDLGRPDRLQLVFGHRLHRSKKGPPRTRVFNDGIHISLHVQHGATHVKQYWKHNRALRTETTFNNTYDVKVGRKLTEENLARLLAIGNDYNRRLLLMERALHQASPVASEFEALILPAGPPGQRAPGFRFGDPRVMALFAALSRFQLNVFDGFRCRELRQLVEDHLAAPYSMAQAAYDLRRLARKGLLIRLPNCHRYRLTAAGRRWTTFCSALYAKTLCPAAAQLHRNPPAGPLGIAFRAYDAALQTHVVAARRVA